VDLPPTGVCFFRTSPSPSPSPLFFSFLLTNPDPNELPPLAGARRLRRLRACGLPQIACSASGLRALRGRHCGPSPLLAERTGRRQPPRHQGRQDGSERECGCSAASPNRQSAFASRIGARPAKPGSRNGEERPWVRQRSPQSSFLNFRSSEKSPDAQRSRAVRTVGIGRGCSSGAPKFSSL
jgi:hypothetical protein